MKTEYKKDLRNNYLVVEPEGEVNSEDYDVRMMEQNRISGILPVQVRKLDGSCFLYYEITSMHPLDNVYERKQLCSDDIRYILSEVGNILESARKYLLNPGQILFEPQYMFMGIENRRINVCYLPVKGCSFSVLSLAEFILKKLNHEDQSAVMLGYDFYQKTNEPNFSLSDTLREVLSGNRSRGQENGRATEEEWPKKGYREYKKEDFGEEEYTGGGGRRTDFENEDEADLYETYHKERKFRISDSKKNRNGNRRLNGIFQAVHPIILLMTVLLTAVLGVLLYFQWLGFTETGGLFFILLSIAILSNRSWKSRKEKEDKRKKKQRYDQIWDQELFEEAGRPAGDDRSDHMIYEEKTQCLREPTENQGMDLISEWPERYPAIHIRKRILVVGKKRGQADIVLDEAAISRIHARLECYSGTCYVTDLDSKNGTYLNGIRLLPQERTKIREGDRIEFANISYQAAAEDESEMTKLLR